MAGYFGTASDSGASVYSGSTGRIQIADDRYAEAYVVRDGQGDSELYARLSDQSSHTLRTIEVKEDSDLNYDPSIAALGDGKFVVAWTNSDDDDAATDTHVLARVYNADGSQASARLPVSGNGEQHADEASVAGLSGKEFVVAYENDTTHEVQAAVYTQGRFGSWAVHDIAVDSSVGANGGNPTVSRVSGTSFDVQYTDADGHQATYHGSYSASVGGTPYPPSGILHGLLGRLGDTLHSTTHTGLF